MTVSVDVKIATLLREMSCDDLGGCAPEPAKALIEAARAQLTEALIEVVLARVEEPADAPEAPVETPLQDDAASATEDVETMPIERGLERFIAEQHAEAYASALARIQRARAAGLFGNGASASLSTNHQEGEKDDVDQDFP